MGPVALAVTKAIHSEERTPEAFLFHAADCYWYAWCHTSNDRLFLRSHFASRNADERAVAAADPRSFGLLRALKTFPEMSPGARRILARTGA